jgi:3-(3-hydroxy-phenyl)propionate hydroxylase
MKAEFPAERWFWFDPPFHPGQSVLLHKQTDSVFRIDFQLGWDADPEQEKKPENVLPRIKAMLGDDREFELEWVSVYTFQCRRMGSFNHGRVLFVGDAAHQVSPFGARGANSGLQDADNLGWKLKLVIDGKAPEKLLDSYSEERIFAADENLMNSTRSTDFITPKSRVSRTFRNAVLSLAKDHAFGRALVNSGRLSVPAFLTTSSLNTPDEAGDAFTGRMVPGAPMDDAPLRDNEGDCWLLEKVGQQFIALYFAEDAAVLPASTIAALSALSCNGISVQPLVISAKPGKPAGDMLVGAQQIDRARHGLSAAPRPACRRALAQVRCRKAQGRRRPGDVQLVNPKTTSPATEDTENTETTKLCSSRASWLEARMEVMAAACFPLCSL